jgi:hypothetical protein
MAKQDFPPNIDRRRLLVSAVALAGSSIEPGVGYAKAASATAAAQSIASAPGVQDLNVRPATARRLLEIERRNLLRAEAHLPLLSITKELRRMKQQEVSEEFERFAAAHGQGNVGGGSEAPSGGGRKSKLEAEQPGGHVLPQQSSQNSLGKVLPVTASECGGPHV